MSTSVPALHSFSHAFALLACALAPSCSHDSHDHPHPTPTAAAARPEWTLANLGERYLVHLIHPAVASGATAELLLHGTRLDTGGAIANARIELIARAADGSEARFSATEKLPGHFPISVTFPRAGRWTLAAHVDSPAGVEQVELGALQVHADSSSALAARPPDRSNALLFAIEAQWPLAMRFERATPSSFVERRAFLGRIELPPGAEAHAAAPLEGRVRAPFNQPLPVPGQRIAADEVLAWIDPPLTNADVVSMSALRLQQHQVRHELDLQGLEANRLLGLARARATAAEREIARAERLKENSFGTQQEIDLARSALELARAEEHAARASLSSVDDLHVEHAADPSLDRPSAAVHAPIAGVIAASHAVRGESVASGTTLFEIVDTAQLWLAVDVPEGEFARLRQPPAAFVRARQANEAFVELGAPVFTAPRVEPESRTVRMSFDLGAHSERLLAGALCDVEIAGAALSDALSVPETALVFEQGRPTLFVMLDAEHFEKRRVKLGARAGARAQIVEGLASGEIVVATHAEELRLASLAGSGAIQDHHH